MRGSVRCLGGAQGEGEVHCRAHIQQTPVAEDAQQRVHVALAREVEAGSDVASGGHHATRVPEK